MHRADDKKGGIRHFWKVDALERQHVGSLGALPRDYFRNIKATATYQIVIRGAVV